MIPPARRKFFGVSISITNLREEAAAVVDAVAERGKNITILRRSQPVAYIVPVCAVCQGLAPDNHCIITTCKGTR